MLFIPQVPAIPFSIIYASEIQYVCFTCAGTEWLHLFNNRFFWCFPEDRYMYFHDILYVHMCHVPQACNIIKMVLNIEHILKSLIFEVAGL